MALSGKQLDEYLASEIESLTMRTTNQPTENKTKAALYAEACQTRDEQSYDFPPPDTFLPEEEAECPPSPEDFTIFDN